jgi:hypothetical protein
MKIDSTPTRQNGDPSNGVNDSSSTVKMSVNSRASSFRVEWSDQDARVTRMGGLAFFVQYLETTGLFEHLVYQCPLVYESNNAPKKRDLLGTMLLSVLSGQTRYAHISSLSGSGLDAQLMKMDKIPSEDSVRACMLRLVKTPEAAQATREWLEGCFDALSSGVLEVPWVLDVDVTVKPLYGKQEGAVLGYNPAKPGRPSHAYHSFWVGHLRLCLDVQVRPGNETAGSFGLGSVIDWLARRAVSELPEFVRGDIGYGTQTWMQELEALGVAYLFKLKQTKGVKELVSLCEIQSEWEQGLGNWQYCESSLQLCGWSQSRRVLVYRRAHHRKGTTAKPVAALPGTVLQSELLPLEITEAGSLSYEYAIYVTSLAESADKIRNLYNPRGDNENCYDELKNQWGWGGFTLKDLARSELMARFIALIYNWWSIFTKLVDDQIAREAITSRPMLLMHTAKVSTHQSTRTLVVFCAHAQAERIRDILEVAAGPLQAWASLTAEQFKQRSVWRRMIDHILVHHQTVGAAKSRSPPIIALQS